MKYYLSGPGYTRWDKRARTSRLFDTELSVVQAAYSYFYEHPISQIDVVRCGDDGEKPLTIVMKLHRRKGKVDPAVWLRSVDEVTEPAI